MNGLIYLLAAIILLAVLLYWNSRQKPYETEHHSEEPVAHHIEAAPAEAQAEPSPPEPTDEPPATDTAEPAAQAADDLTKIEGIGPKIAGLLAEGGFATYAELSEADTSQLEAILEAAGSRYRLADPTTWPAQAKLAAGGDWDKLAELQDDLSGGRSEEGS